MYKVDIQNKKLIEIPTATYTELNLRERFDIQEWIADTPEILGEPLLIISKELVLPSGRRLDLLAVEQRGGRVDSIFSYSACSSPPLDLSSIGIAAIVHSFLYPEEPSQKS